MTRFTEGEWVVMRDHPNTVQVARGNKGGFVVIDTPQETQEADARLIAAAKELYQALFEMVLHWDGNLPESQQEGFLFRARQALIKADEDSANRCL